MRQAMVRRRSVVGLLALAAVLLAPGAAPTGAAPTGAVGGASGTWTLTGRLATAVSFQTATLLASGQVLVAGGDIGGNETTAAQVYNPQTGRWRATGSMVYPREQQTATLLPGGQVLVAGGEVEDGALSNAELYTPARDPARGTFTLTPNDMSTVRVNHTATLLRNGKVLLTGGCSGIFFGCVFTWSSADLYDPATALFTATGSMSQARMYHTATLLPTGQVLVAGGTGCATCLGTNQADLYNPTTGTFRSARGLMTAGRALHSATLLRSGLVLLAGGCVGVNGPTCRPSAVLRSAELYNPLTQTFTPTGSMVMARYGHTATLLPNGQVLIAGGLACADNCVGLTSAELYDPATGTFTTTGSLGVQHVYGPATRLPSGQVLVAGGCIRITAGGACNGPTRIAELYNP